MLSVRHLQLAASISMLNPLPGYHMGAMMTLHLLPPWSIDACLSAAGRTELISCWTLHSIAVPCCWGAWHCTSSVMVLVLDLSQSSSRVWWDNGIWNLVRVPGMHLLSEQSCIVFTTDLPVAEARQVSTLRRLLQATVAWLVPAPIRCNAGLSVTGIAALCAAIFCHVLCRVSVQCCQGYWAGSLTEVAADGLHAGVQRAEGRNHSEELSTRRCTAELANSPAFPLVCSRHCAL